ncbi:MAG: hypothetical protein ACTH7O_04870 [Microbacterium gubbeenense]
MRRVTGWAAAEAGIAPVLEVPNDMVEVSCRGDVLTIINYGSEPARFAVTGTEVSSGERVSSVDLDQYDWIMLDQAR